MINDKGITKYPGKSLSLCYFFRDKSHMDCLGSEIGETLRRVTQQGLNDRQCSVPLHDLTENWDFRYRHKHQIVHFHCLWNCCCCCCCRRRRFLLRGERSGDRIPVGARFSAPVQTGSETHPDFFTIGTGSFPGVQRPGCGVDHPPTSSAGVKGRVQL